MELPASPLIFNLHWLRETASDRGTPLRPDELDAAVRSRVLKAVGGTPGEFRLKLPYLDRRELRRRNEVLGPIHFVRQGTEIVPVLNPRLALRTLAADLALTNPAWLAAPTGRHRNRFRVWQRISKSLQRSLRKWVANEYFRDLRVCEDRETTYAVIIYRAARVFRGSAPHDFVYDLLDYPACKDTLEAAWRLTGASIRRVLDGLERRLAAAGLTRLSRLYAPRWHEDILVEVRRRPKDFVEILRSESKLINGMADLASIREPRSVCTFADTANQAMRRVAGIDLRHLAPRALQETTRLLEEMLDEGLFAPH
jgi:hypothetical protein